MARSDTPDSKRLRIFVSYSRSNMAACDKLAKALEAADFKVIVDRRDLPYGEEWQAELSDFIRNADTVLWLISSNSIKSRWCKWELNQVLKLNKRLVTVCLEPVAPNDLPEGLEKIHLLPGQGSFDFSVHLDELVIALNRDGDWLKQYSRLADRAHEWNSRQQDSGGLLRGSALQAAENWLDRRRDTAPNPHQDVLDLILASKRAAVRRQRLIVSLSIGSAIVGLGLAGIAFWQQRVAVANEELALDALKTQSRLVAIRSRDQSKAGMQLEGALLATEVLPDQRAKNGLRRDWPYTPTAHHRLLSAMTGRYSSAIFPEPAVTGHGANFGPKGQLLISTSYKSGAVIWDIRSGRIVHRLWGHTSDVNDAVFSIDGKMAATASVDKTVRIWDVATGQTKFVLNADPNKKAFASAPNRVLIAPDNSFVVATLYQQEKEKHVAILWKMVDGAVARTLDAQDDAISDVALSPDGKVLAIGTGKGTLRLVGTENGELLRTLDNLKSYPTLDFDPSEATSSLYRILLTGPENSIRVLELSATHDTSGKLVLSASKENLRFRLETAPEGVAYGHDGKHIILNKSGSNVVELWNAKSGVRLRSLLQLGSPSAGRVRLSPDGKHFLTPGTISGPTLWSVSGQSEFSILDTGSDPRGKFTPDGKSVVVATSAGSLVLFAGPDFSDRIHLEGHTDSVTSIAFLPNRHGLVTAGKDGRINVWDYNARKKEKTFKLPDRYHADTRAVGAVVSPNGRWLLAKSQDGCKAFAWNLAADSSKRLSLYSDEDAKSGQCSTFEIYESRQRQMAFSSDETLVALGDSNGTLQVWELVAGTARHLAGHSQRINSVDFHPEKPLLLSASNDGKEILWNASDGQSVHVFDARGFKVTSALFSPNGDEAVLGIDDGTIGIWSIATGNLLRTLRGHEAGVASLAFSPDGTRLLSSSEDGTARVWQFFSGRHLATLETNSYTNMIDATFSADGRHILGRTPFSLVLWANYWTIDKPLQESIDRARHRAPRCLTSLQRRQFHLPPEPPRWCITGPGLENEVDPNKWQPKWPFEAKAWKQWLARRDAGENPELPNGTEQESGAAPPHKIQRN